MKLLILLPASALNGLSATQLEWLICHGLAPVRRHDDLVNLLQTWVEALFFFHTVVWWISRRVRVEREYCCDDIAGTACGEPAVHARALATMEELRFDRLAAAASGGALLPRIERSLGRAPRRGRYPRGVLIGRALSFSLGGLLCACAASSGGTPTPVLPDRAEFARKMASIEVGMTRAEVVALLGQPSRVIPKSELHTARTEVVLGYGATTYPDETSGFASLGSVYIDDGDRVQYVFGKRSYEPIDLPERELRYLLDLIDRTPSYQQLPKYRPNAIILVVNALLPLGKHKALAVIDEYLRVASQYHSTARAGLFLVLRTMFDVPEDPGYHFRMMVGGPVPSEPADRTVFPRFPVALVDDIPYLLVQGYQLGGEAEPVANHVEKFRAEGVMRQEALRPERKGQAPLEALQAKVRVELGGSEYLLGELELQWTSTTGMKFSR